MLTSTYRRILLTVLGLAMSSPMFAEANPFMPAKPNPADAASAPQSPALPSILPDEAADMQRLRELAQTSTLDRRKGTDSEEAKIEPPEKRELGRINGIVVYEYLAPGRN